MCILETKRCILKKFQINDFDHLFSIHGSKDVMAFVGTGARSKEVVQNHLTNLIQHQETYGYSGWAVYDKDTNEFIGRAGIVHVGTLVKMEMGSKEDVPVELGYMLRPKFWGKGLATELASAVIKWTFNNTKLDKLVAKTGISNKVSQKVLKSNNFTFLKDISIEGRPGILFSLTRKEYGGCVS
jgi:[ribosomal protein S5]-alanine N-acetyltransferase